MLKPYKDKEGGGTYPKKSYWHLDPQEEVCKSSILKLHPPILKNKIDHQQVCEK
jgi:hypothetical protein